MRNGLVVCALAVGMAIAAPAMAEDGKGCVWSDTVSAVKGFFGLQTAEAETSACGAKGADNRLSGFAQLVKQANAEQASASACEASAKLSKAEGKAACDASGAKAAKLTKSESKAGAACNVSGEKPAKLTKAEEAPACCATKAEAAKVTKTSGDAAAEPFVGAVSKTDIGLVAAVAAAANAEKTEKGAACHAGAKSAEAKACHSGANAKLSEAESDDAKAKTAAATESKALPACCQAKMKSESTD